MRVTCTGVDRRALRWQAGVMAYKPESYNDLSPYLLVRDAAAVLRFCEVVFGATSLRVFRGDDGRVVHAECRIGDSVLMMGEAEGSPVLLHLYLEDPDAAFARGVAAGAEIIQPMEAKGDGDRRGGLRAPDGTQWYLSRQLAGARDAKRAG
ncbi:MAG: VOC family protein [Paracoccus sp. (in: a-proteobacteria)]|nr:VOC family protein [Paracoccus sp. (in: a-proteobacteria)]